MTINPTIFKAYDIRGKYPEEINEEIVYRIGRGLVLFTKAEVVVVGQDIRLSSPALAQALMKGITEQGADVINIGLCSTAMLNFAAAAYELHDAGVMITASHNPKEYNGLKICDTNALPISEATGLQQLKEIVFGGQFPKSRKGQIVETDIADAYLEKVFSLEDWREIKKHKIVVDAGHAMGSLTMRQILRRAKCQLIPLYFRLDGNFPDHEPNPLKEENLHALQEAVRKQKADFGAALDGDADRIIFVDEGGEIVRSDLITILLAREIFRKYPGSKMLYDLRSSWAVAEEIKKLGGAPEMCRVGHSLIKKRMQETNAVFAGELSGHYFYRDFYNVESPDLTLLHLLKILSETSRPLSKLIAPFQRYQHSGEINFVVTDKEKKMKELEKKFSAGAKDISWLDGLRIEFADWWFNVRPSNTEPLLRLNLEAKTPELLEMKKGEIIVLLEVSP